MSHNPMEGIKARKAKATLHKPFSDVPLILEEIKRFNVTSSLERSVHTLPTSLKAYGQSTRDRANYWNLSKHCIPSDIVVL